MRYAATRRLALAFAVVAAASAPALAQKVIVIDPGHGGSDPGGVGTGLQEKSVVIDTSLRFRDLLNADTADAAGGGAWTVHMTRDDDVFVGLSARASYANSVGADRFMSIHSNAFGDPAANGTETFAYAEGGQGAALRNLVQEEMIAAWGLTNRGNKTANFAVLRETAMPAVLHELAFITNSGDAAFLASPAKRQLAAEAHLRAIQRHYGIAPYIPGSMPEPEDGSITGTVSGPDGPIVDALVMIDGEGFGMTGPGGAFAFDGIAVGDHVVSAVAEGYLTSDRGVTVEAGARVTVDFVLEPDDEGGTGPGGGAGEVLGQPADHDRDLHGGCAAGGGTPASGALALAALALLLASRRRALLAAIVALLAACAGEPAEPVDDDRGAPSATLRLDVGSWQGIDVVGLGEAPAADTDQLPRYELRAGDRVVDAPVLDAALDGDTGALAWIDETGALWVAPVRDAPDGASLVAEHVVPGLATSRGRVAFARRIDGPETAAFVADLETGETTALDDGPGPDDVLCFSPGGDEVLLLSGRTGLASLFAAGVHGAGARQLTNVGLAPGPGLDPARVAPAPSDRREVAWGRRGVAYRAGDAVVRLDSGSAVERLDASASVEEVVR